MPSDRPLRRALLGAVLAASAFASIAPSAAMAFTNVDLSNYVRTARYNLPEPTRTTAPTNSLLAQETSAVTYNWDTDTLFVVGDGGTSVVQVTKTGQLIDSMTLPPGSSPQGTEFYDPEGLAYIGNGQFVMTEERDRQLVRFTYAAGTSLQRSQTKTVKLGTTIGNIGLEGVTYDRASGDFIPVKGTTPLGIFRTSVDFDAGTASNGSPTTINSVNLFDPALAGLLDFADVYALSNATNLTGPQSDNLLVLSQESGKVVNISRTGVVASSLTLQPDATDTLAIPDMTIEGVAMDNDGTLYVASENGGGSVDFPQLWVYQPATAPNAGPTAVTLTNQTTSLVENTSTAQRVKVADITVTDDGLGTNTLGVTGPDSAFFEVVGGSLFVKAGTTLDFETKPTYRVSATADDTTVGGTPDATSAQFTLSLTDIVNEGSTTADLRITEVSPWSSGNSPYGADWFEVTNVGAASVDLTGYKMDDDSGSGASPAPVVLTGVGTLGPGESAVFIEAASDSVITSFKNSWFGGGGPLGYKMGRYTGSGVGLGTGGDQVNLFTPGNVRVAGVRFGASTTGRTFDNAAGANGASGVPPLISTLSTAGENGAFTSNSETGSPGTINQVAVTEASPWSSGNSPYGADWFEVTNKGKQPLYLSGWRFDDDSRTFANAVALNGVASIAPGTSAVFIEGTATTVANFRAYWFGSAVPPIQVGSYSGAGVGLGTGGDQVNLFDSFGNRPAGIALPASTTGRTFDNTAAAGSNTTTVPTVSTLSSDEVNGGRVTGRETGGPGETVNPCDTPAAIHLGAGDNTYVGTAAAEIICGDAGTDYIRGGGGQDRIYGGDGNDTILDGADSADIHGGAGTDVLGAEGGDDLLAGGPGIDRVTYATRTAAVTQTLGGGALGGVAGEEDRIAQDVEDLRGGTGNDRLTGDGNANSLTGLAGNDTLLGLDGSDTLRGAEGDDRLEGGTGNDVLDANDGADTLIDGTGGDTLLGGPGADLLTITADGTADLASCGTETDQVSPSNEALDRINRDCEPTI